MIEEVYIKLIHITLFGIFLSFPAIAQVKFDPTKPYTIFDPKSAVLVPSFEGQQCSTNKRLMNVIFDNCFVSKSDGATKYQVDSIENICKRIACNPSMWEKLKYK